MADFSDPAAVWQAVLGRLNMEMPREHFNTFLRPCVGHSWTDDGAALVVAATSSFAVSWLELPLHLAMANDALARTLGREVSIHYQAMPSVSRVDEADPPERVRVQRIVGASRANGAGLWGNLGDLALAVGNGFSDFVERDDLLGGDTALDTVASWAIDPEGWVILIGPPGVGKTHLAAAAAGEASEGHGTLFENWGGLLDDLRKWIDDSVKDVADKSDQVTTATSRNAPVLILDDLREPRGPWQRDVLRSIIHHRYDHRMPTLITTNHIWADFEAAFGSSVASRMLDRRLTTVLHLIGPDYRRWG